MARAPALLAQLADGRADADAVRIDVEAGTVDAPRYALRAADLRRPEQVAAALASAGADLRHAQLR
jgi:hypothetical protein